MLTHLTTKACFLLLPGLMMAGADVCRDVSPAEGERLAHYVAQKYHVRYTPRFVWRASSKWARLAIGSSYSKAMALWAPIRSLCMHLRICVSSAATFSIRRWIPGAKSAPTRRNAWANSWKGNSPRLGPPRLR